MSLSSLAAFLVIVTLTPPALDPEPHPLLPTIEALDRQIFDAAFLTCDADALRGLMTEDLEFYNDLYGLIATSVDDFLAGTIPDCRARSEGTARYLERRLDPGSMQLRPIGDWGLIQTGSHSFYGRDDQGQDVLLETGVFMHLWEKSDAGWRIKRVISYDHVSP